MVQTMYIPCIFVSELAGTRTVALVARVPKG